MRAYLIKRLAFMAVTLVVITVVYYTMMRLAPGSPERAKLFGGEEQGTVRADRKESQGREIMRRKYHFDRGPLVGYGFWARDIFTRLDFGSSIVIDPGKPVLRLIGERLPVTLKLNFWAIILVYAAAVPIGIYAAVNHRRLIERGTTVFLFLLYSLPTFWTALVLMMFFCSDRFLNIFPVSGIVPDPSWTWGKTYWQILGETARHYVLPVFCLCYAGLASLSRFTRVGMLEVIRQDYVRTARAKGAPEWRVILIHAFRNGLIPLVTLFAGLLPGLVAGSVIIEWIFSIPGMGQLAINALSARDYFLMMAIFSMGAFLELLGILLSDICYVLVDPRITFS